MNREYVLPVNQYSGTSVPGAVLIFIKPIYSSVDSIKRININHEHTCWHTPDL